jgi:hypothetical protein
MSNFNGLLRRYIDIVNEAAELRTPAEIAASADLLSANDGSTTSGAAPAARNPNAGLTPDDPRWQGPKPAAAPNAAAVAGVTPKPQIPAAAPAAAAPAAAPAATPAATPAPAAAKMADGGPPATPEQLKWLGGADKTDPIILSRMRKAVPNAPAAATPAAAPAATPAAAPAATPAAAPAAVAPGAATGVNAQGQNVTMPDGTNPETGAPTVTTQGAPAAKPRVPAKSDPAVQKIQQDLIAKGAKIKADGVMGPATQAAMKQFGQGAKPAPVPGKAAPVGGAPGTMGASDPMTGMPYSPMPESVYREDQALARIIQLARG